jgi:hypothetical protein
MANSGPAEQFLPATNGGEGIRIQRERFDRSHACSRSAVQVLTHCAGVSQPRWPVSTP